MINLQSNKSGLISYPFIIFASLTVFGNETPFVSGMKKYVMIETAFNIVIITVVNHSLSEKVNGS